jgi:Raf kinase inhibitor-like YbhB/YbcL family protein
MSGTRLLLALVPTALLVTLVAAGCSSNDDGEPDTAPAAAASDQASGEAAPTPEPVDAGQAASQQVEASIVFTSPAFDEIKRIPKKHTCTEISGNEPNVSPPLAWEAIPDGTVSLVVIVHSQEVEGAERVHWVVWNMPPTLTGLEENVEHAAKLADGTAQGTNGVGEVGYFGPCPPVIVQGSGGQGGGQKKRDIEKYYFKLYALDTMLDLPSSTTRADLLKAIDGHILASGELVGERQGPVKVIEHI